MTRFTQNLSYGMMNKEVYRLQQFLESKEYGDFIPSGAFGTKTFNAVKKFQTIHGITPVSGFVGPKTRMVINEKISDDNRMHLYDVACDSLGKDASPEDIAPDELACVETVEAIYKTAFGHYIGYGDRPCLHTGQLYVQLMGSRDFMPVNVPLPGDLILSPTGQGNGNLSNGHVGILGKAEIVMSNSSATGTFIENYTLQTWKERYQVKGGFPVLFFRRL